MRHPTISSTQTTYIDEFFWLLTGSSGSTPLRFFAHRVTKVAIECYHGRALAAGGRDVPTSHDLTPNGGVAREIPLFQGNLVW